MQLNPRQIEAFRMVMLRGSVTAAAAFMNISQPAVSRLIRDLEARAGLVLFDRQGNHLVPTPEANLLLAEVERYAYGLSALSSFAQELGAKRRGSLRIVALPAMAMGFLPKFVAGFVKSRSLTRVYIHGMPSHMVVDAVASGQADFGFAAAPTERPGLVITPLEANVVVVVPRKHKLAKCRSVGVQDIQGERIIALSEPSIYSGPVPRRLDELLRDATIVTPLTGIACKFVAAGAGIALVDPFSVSGMDDPSLVTVRFEPAIGNRISIVTSANGRLSTLSQEFIASLREALPSLIGAGRITRDRER